MNFTTRTLLSRTALAIAACVSTAAHAGTSTLTLVRSNLTNVTDAAGIWQHEAGKIHNAGGAVIGSYQTARRVTTGGGDAYNAAATTITLYFPPLTTGGAPPNLTLQGSHSYTSGNFVGAVSAASAGYHWAVASDATYSIPASGTTKVVITWVASPALHIP